MSTCGKSLGKNNLYLRASAQLLVSPQRVQIVFLIPTPGQDCSLPKNNDISASSSVCRLSGNWRPRRNISRYSSLSESASGPETRREEGWVRFPGPRLDFSKAQIKALSANPESLLLIPLTSRDTTESRVYRAERKNG